MHNRDERSLTRNDTLPRTEIPVDQHQKRWLLALRHSNVDAFDALYKALSEPLLRYAWMLTRDEDMIYATPRGGSVQKSLCLSGRRGLLFDKAGSDLYAVQHH